MKILLVSEYYPPKIFGGGEISAEHLARALEGKGIDISVLTSKVQGLEEFEVRNGVKIHRKIKTGNGPSSILSALERKILFPRSVKNELVKLDMEENFDLIHFLNTSGIVPYKKRTIATINGYGNFCPKGNLFYKDKEVCTGCNFLKFPGCILNSEYAGKVKLRPHLKFNPGFWILAYWNFKRRNRILGGINGFIAISGFIKNLLMGNGIPGDMIRQIPNIISIKDSENEYPLEIEKPVVTYIGVLEKIKGVDLLIRAFNQIKGNATLLIVGDGSEREKLEKMAREGGDERIRFLGSVGYESVPSIYKQSDIIALTARWPEPLPRVLIEACCFGKPIIATAVGGNSNIVINERNGFLVETEIADIEDKLGYLLRNPILMKEMGDESRKIFEREFNMNGIIDEIINFYDI